LELEHKTAMEDIAKSKDFFEKLLQKY
jgi:hypothetical protein